MTSKTLTFDICIIGAGAGGLSVAAGASKIGASVVLIERHKMGGDCLNSGCIPSKSLLFAAKRAKLIRESQPFGITTNISDIDFQKIHEYLHQTIANIGQNDSVERFEKLGVTVIKGTASFADNKTVKVNDKTIQAKWFVIATGSSPVIPFFPNIEKINLLTNENIFDLEQKPEHLLILGGGPISCEIAQAYSLLGTKVTIIQRSHILRKDEPELTEVIRQQLKKDGVTLYEKALIQSIRQNDAQIHITIEHARQEQEIISSHLFVATGRKPDIESLNLDAAGIKYSEKGIIVDNRLRANHKHVFAVGDVAGGPQFTHVASYHAGIVIRNILFRLPAKIDYSALPWVTYTSPELAHVGLTEADAKKRFSKIRILTSPFSENDRAQTENDIQGLTKVITTAKGQILGASIVGHNAGELITPWSLAITQKLKIKHFANLIIPYPTRSEINKKIAGQFYMPMLYSSRIKKIINFLMQWLP